MATERLPRSKSRGLTKRFFSTLALDHVDLSIVRGRDPCAGRRERRRQVHADQNPGRRLPAGRRRDPRRRAPGASRTAEAVPLAFVHQDLGLVDDLSVGENVALVAGFPRTRRPDLLEPRSGRRPSRSMRAMAVEPPDPRAAGGRAERRRQGGARHRARAVAGRPRSWCSTSRPPRCPGRTRCICSRCCAGCAASGTSILYVSHRLNELFGLVDRVTVLRDGRHVRTSAIADADAGRARAGHARPRPRAASRRIGRARAPAAPVLQVEDLCRRQSGAAQLPGGGGRDRRARGPARRRP